MHLFARTFVSFAVVSASLVCQFAVLAVAQAAAPASDTILSDATRGFASIGDLRTLEQHWQQTQLGQLVKDPVMKPFVEDMKQQIQRKMSGVQEKLGLTFDDIREIAAGEVGMGIVERKNERAVLAVTIDVTGRRPAVDALLAKIEIDLKKRNATKSTAESSGVPLTVFHIPARREGAVAHDAIFFVEHDTLCGVDNRAEADAMIRRLKGQGSDNLASVAAYQETMKRCAAEAGDLVPEVRWYADPFGYARAARSLAKPGSKPPGKDYVEILKDQGFDAVKGAGGYVNLLVGGTYELLHRTAVYAPAIPGEKEKYQRAMRMMQFPNGGELKPQSWIPRGLASYRTFNMELGDAFKYVDSLFDAIAGYDHAFADVIEGLKEDPYGPQVDVQKDFVAFLGKRVTMVTDYNVPITTKSERYLFAVELSNEQKVAATVAKFMKADPNAFRREFEGKVVWEITEPKEDVPELEIEFGELDPLSAEPAPGEGGAGHKHAPASAVCVTGGHLLIASHLEFLEHVLSIRSQQDALVGSGDFHQVDAALNQLIDDPVCARCFVRTDEAYRPTYELLRQGKMPESETLLGRFLNRMLTPPEDEEEGKLRQQKIDAKNLPSFEMVRRYFSPAGTLVRADEDGWFVVGATLSKQPAQARAETGTSAVETTLR